MPQRRRVRQWHERRRTRRGGARPLRRKYARPRPRIGALRYHDEVVAGAVGRHGHWSPRGGQRGREAGQHGRGRRRRRGWPLCCDCGPSSRRRADHLAESQSRPPGACAEVRRDGHHCGAWRCRGRGSPRTDRWPRSRRRAGMCGHRQIAVHRIRDRPRRLDRRRGWSSARGRGSDGPGDLRQHRASRRRCPRSRVPSGPSR